MAELDVRLRALAAENERLRAQLQNAEARSRRPATAPRRVSGRQRMERRLRFLAEAGRLLPSSLNVTETLAGVARIAVTTIADWSVVYLAGPDDTFEQIAVVHADPAKARVVEEFRRRYTLGPGEPAYAWHVLHGGHTDLVNDISEERLMRAVPDPEQRRLVRELGIASAIFVPLAARGRALGVLGLFVGDRSRRFTGDDVALVEEIGRRAALAVDNARLYEEAQDAIRARDKFLSIASHELRTPVTVIKGSAQLLLRALERGELDTTRLARFLRSLRDASDRLVALTDDLLDVSRLRTGLLELRPRPTDLAALVREVAERHQDHLGAGQTLKVVTEPVAPVLVDAERLDQVVTNLITNAIKYSPEGGPIHVAVRAVDDGALIEVRDNGIGLPPGAAESIFEPFGRAPNAAKWQIQGMGLGLHICRGIVERHGGRIWAESSGEGQGTTLRVWLPLNDEGRATKDDA